MTTLWGVYRCTDTASPETRVISNAMKYEREQGALHTSLLEAYKSAVPPEAFIASADNAWHVKVLNAVVSQMRDQPPCFGLLVCRNADFLDAVYIYHDSDAYEHINK